ncbi:MAG: acylphosphatase [Burkholderiales bacterium]|nr:acylphosphatase [Burkholderiales bacterium]
MEFSRPEVAPLVKIGKIARRLRITGIVQGVGYRAALCSAAQARRVDGWVRNRRDGSVEAEVAGAPEAVAALLDWAKRGPPAAQVADVHVEPIDPGVEHAGGFTQRPTV